ncbi:hypothetical protein NDU88_001560 [Pleurodeles waltl]|uniref:Uncharacterized protein n=1 Tax=Pleurodeles waltl TaxID=8319 RepID=A0AAV7UAK7_PLEWA|nr:hypothetical protein NDU88_001560 [Pleurodeles waltl]
MVESGSSTQEPSGPPGAQILALMLELRAKIYTICQAVNLLRVDFRTVMERSLDIEQDVTVLQEEVKSLTATVGVLTDLTRHPEDKVEDEEGHA